MSKPKTTSSLGSVRARRKEKARKDEETQHKLWTVRLQELMDEHTTAFQAVAKLETEKNAQLKKIHPTRQAQFQLTWMSFKRRIENATKH